jgi:hypothetical protein
MVVNNSPCLIVRGARTFFASKHRSYRHEKARRPSPVQRAFSCAVDQCATAACSSIFCRRLSGRISVQVSSM